MPRHCRYFRFNFIPFQYRGKSKNSAASKAINVKRRADGSRPTQATDQMSESYHEIFDTLMPPETAKAKLLAESSETEMEDAREALSSCDLEKPDSPSR